MRGIISHRVVSVFK